MTEALHDYVKEDPLTLVTNLEQDLTHQVFDPLEDQLMIPSTESSPSTGDSEMFEENDDASHDF